jgi:hypothetical protein
MRRACVMEYSRSLSPAERLKASNPARRMFRESGLSGGDGSLFGANPSHVVGERDNAKHSTQCAMENGRQQGDGSKGCGASAPNHPSGSPGLLGRVRVQGVRSSCSGRGSLHPARGATGPPSSVGDRHRQGRLGKGHQAKSSTRKKPNGSQGRSGGLPVSPRRDARPHRRKVFAEK